MADPWRAFSTRLFDQNLFAVKLGLQNMRLALDLEGSPDKAQAAIVVGGTNGKGSVSALLSNILEAHGLKCGLYTSPHLIEVRERFRINGAPVSREQTMRVGKQLLQKYGRPDATPCLTFFELTTLMAAKIFEEEKVDVAIWEVGLGGRLDAVNTIEPALTVITTIGLDHQEYLGNTIPLISLEKAALARKGIPTLIGRQDHEDARQTLLEAIPDAIEVPWVEDEADFRQRHISTATLAAQTYLGDRFDAEKAQSAVLRTRWRGRLESLEINGATWLIDGAHNIDGARHFAAFMRHYEPDTFLIGAMKDKDLEGVFGWLKRPPFESIPIVSATLKTQRSAQSDQIRSTLDRAIHFESLEEALEEIRENGFGKIAAFGSLYLVGELLMELGLSSEDLTTWKD
ncbi:hypothetical protein FRD01_02210 [Microvenator marinus]|uniref:tetrahydrofolate synthase n=1 Tax=Microvenator marinus TaxID=2600177 RepID=A0A5B8XJW6_9DELT|nr:cyanophycin synthetase [Microvenator marinus]QED26092.1 hypothetical protein FRD01_02210 [Microvenator marinus]